MKIESHGYTPDPSTDKQAEAEFDLFAEHLNLIRKNESIIFSNRDYFFCTPKFAWCSFPYICGDGQLPLGYLLAGWNEGILLEQCPDCSSSVFVTAFWGSPLSGSNEWTGICETCREKKRGSKTIQTSFAARVIYITQLRKKYPVVVNERVLHDGFEFNWFGLAPARKRRREAVKTANPVSLKILIENLSANNHPDGTPPNVSLLGSTHKLKFTINGTRSLFDN